MSKVQSYYAEMEEQFMDADYDLWYLEHGERVEEYIDEMAREWEEEVAHTEKVEGILSQVFGE